MTNTPRTTRRPRRAIAAISAVLLGASVLAAVMSSPAQAVNTASEALIDTNNDGVVDAREFGGRDRYDTALRLAQNFGRSKGLGGVAEAFVASGETLVDAVAVSGLAGYLDAPVVLTYQDSLPGAVADYLEDYDVQNIHVLGGPAAVSEAVFESLESLDHSPTVARIQGTDRYGTAADIATRLSGGTAAGNVWCGGEEAAAILANGGDVSLAYAMLAGPMASRLQLPVLLTALDELPDATRDIISDQDYEHIVIVGGTSSVSADVSADLTTAGVNTITRISGATPAEVSARLAELATNGCRGDLGGVSDTTVALVGENALPDGVTASPVLASSYRSGELVPMLVVGASLPGVVRDFLAATPQEDAVGNKLHMEIVAIGGQAAVTRGAMSAAIDAAASASALTVRIVSPTDWDNDGQMDDAPRAGETSFELRFSDDVAGDADDASDATAQLRGRLLDVLRIGGVPAVLAGQTDTPPGVDFGGSTVDCTPDVVTVNLASPLTAGQPIAIADTTLEFGARSDRRPLARSSTSVVRKEVRRPTFEIISIIGQTSFTVIAKDNQNTDTGLADGETLDSAEITATSRDDDLSVLSVVGGAVDTSSGRVTERTFTVNVDRALVSSDRIKIAKDAIMDDAGNQNAERTSPTPITPTNNVRVTSVRVSGQFHDTQAKYAVPTALTGGNGADGGLEDVFFTAKVNGRAGGANGNGWTFDFRRASTYNANKPVSFEVLVDTTGKRAFITFVNGKPKFADLAAALRSHSGFNGLWDVSVDNVQNACAPANKELTVAGAVTATGDQDVSADKVRDGNTMMAIEANFSGHVATVHSNPLLEDVFAATVIRVPTAALSDIGLGNEDDITGPVRSARWVASTEDVTRLPKSGDRYDVEADTIADGYVDNNPDTTDIDESVNRAQTRLTVSSGGTTPR
ncbi:cell wall-binding repeat-containing protein [Candidatus Poriferisodalis sp.]|uniref:cell wall-binding repeat-containing protein n=1 Tax=Candidatus Poriferisodalis sp. TaxID=3101277 RepID=UPI003B5953B5